MESITLGRVGRVELATPFLNAAGGCTPQQLDTLSECKAVGALVTKSCTRKARGGNGGPNYVYEGALQSACNAIGLRNPGAEATFAHAQELARKKTTIVSCAVIEPNDFEWVRECATRYSISALELNISCPNSGCVPIAYEFQKFEQLCDLVRNSRAHLAIAIGIKLPPYVEIGQREAALRLLQKYEIDFVTCCNTLPNALMMRGNSSISGGLSGKSLQPLSLSMTKYFAPHIDTIGCGGIFHASDAEMYLKLGAKAVQIGTALRENACSISEINARL